MAVYTGTQSGTSQKRVGIASLTVDGEVFDVVSDLVYNSVSVSRETLAGQSGVQGFAEKGVANKIGAKLRDSGTMNVGSMMAKISSTLVLIINNGKTVYGNGLWCTECTDVNTSDATFNVMFEGVGGSVTEAPL